MSLNLSSVLVDAHIEAGLADKTAAVLDGQRVSYAKLQRRVAALAGGLQAAGVEPGDRVVLALANSLDLISLWLATQQLGAVAVTTSHTLRRRELSAVIEDAEPRLVVAGSGLWSDLGSSAKVVGIETIDGSPGAGAPPHAYDTTPTSLAIIAYTIGTDGRLRGACHSSAEMLAAADSYALHVLGLQQRDVVGGHLPLAFTFGLGALLLFPLRVGATTVPAPAFDAETLLSMIGRERVTVFFGTATCYRLLLRVPHFAQRFDLSSLRVCVSAGEPLEAEVSSQWKKATSVDLVDGLGTTELFHIVVSQRPGQVRHGSLGVPVPGYQLRVVDSAMHDVPDGEEGVLAVRGPTSCQYWRRPNAQREVVRDGWTLTGDVVARDRDGYFWFKRRADNLIVSAGYNIAAPEVESVLEEHPAVVRAAVVGSADPTRGTSVTAFVVLRPDEAARSDLALVLQQHVQRELSPYKCPRRIEFVASLPTRVSRA